MNHLKRFCVVLALFGAFTLPAYAGDISCGGSLTAPCRASATVPEPVEETGPEAETTEGEMVEGALTLLQGLLPVF